MKKTFCILTIILFLISCKEEKRIVEKIDFETEYPFSTEIENRIGNDIVPWKYQISASDYAMKGDYQNALIQWDLAMRNRNETLTKNQVDSINSKYRKVNAVDYIIEQSKNSRLIIINEAHHNSFHRVFTKSLLQRLFYNGFKNLGLEALSYKDDTDSLQNIRKYPVQKTGYYIKDPQFGNLIREAIEIGFTIFPYETQNQEADGKPREIDQAKNIQKFIDSHPNEKYLIHCGFGHVIEGDYEAWEKAMAGRLKEFTDINPLTISQVEFSEKGKPEFNHPFLKALNIDKSTILLDQQNAPYGYEEREKWTDIAIFHPNTKYVDNRPNWLFQNGNKNVPIVLNDIEIEFPTMVLAYKKGENINLAVPIDITEVKTKSEKCNLGLKKGTYEIVVTNGKQSVKFEQSVK